MSEPEQEGKLLLNMGDDQYDLNVIGKALGFARDFVVSRDVMFAAKNLSTDVKLSPLAVLIEDAIGILRDLFEKHADPVPSDEPASPAADS